MIIHEHAINLAFIEKTQQLKTEDNMIKQSERFNTYVKHMTHFNSCSWQKLSELVIDGNLFDLNNNNYEKHTTNIFNNRFFNIFFLRMATRHCHWHL